MKDTVTKGDVFAAADIIAAAGEMPSIMTVRKGMGNRGSESTIIKYLRDWKEQLLKRNATACIFCESSDKESTQLKNELQKYTTLVRDLQRIILSLVREQQDTETIYQLKTRV